ncbi:MAG: zinc ribbon domain-containing protein [Candidatus Thiodiazotropha sp. (ex Semelilucina semeliformis)]|nr:zinc ribbon domain-containing protein [Candidatus Thiodiazotropha sp. (ex Myrtea spinifera)]MCU7806571.1 zinc ribbon domain-containing protein [Candidatus Thiodiazotropha sp. (ex Semelilucina semeliformis)]
MPTYDYYCEANGRKVEVSHKIDTTITTWEALANLAGIDPGDTPLETPVKKLISGAAVVNSKTLSNPEPACAGGCSSGRCGL